MSSKRFIQLLQSLLTMVDPNSPTSVACVKTTLESILALVTESGKVDIMTIKLIRMTNAQIDYLIVHKADFAGKPGDIPGNNAKQERLKNMLRPGC